MIIFVLCLQKRMLAPLPNISEQRMVPDMASIIVTEEGVVNLLNTLQPGGPDKIPSRFLKEYGTLLSPALTQIFQASLRCSYKPYKYKSNCSISGSYR